MAELGDVIGGDIITSTFTNELKDRTVMRYANAAARDASITTPQNGDVAWLLTGTLTVYNGSKWLNFLGANLYARAVVFTGPNGEFSIPTGFQPSSAFCQGAQVDFPSAIFLQQMDSSQVTWRVWGLQSGQLVANSPVEVIYQIWG